MEMKRIIFFFLAASLYSCMSYDELITQGLEYSENGKPDEAKICFEKALSKDSTRPDAYYGLGFLQAENCRSNQTGCEYAINHFTQVIRLDSNFRHALYNRANCFMELGMYRQALNDLTTRFSVEKEDVDYFVNRTLCYLQLGDTLNAKYAYKNAVKLNLSRQSDYFDNIFDLYDSQHE